MNDEIDARRDGPDDGDVAGLADGSAADAIPFLVVAVGASAGGLEALTELVRAIPTDSGMAFVVVQHLSPDHVSALHTLLVAHTRLPVEQIEDGQPLRPDTVAIIPPGQRLTLEGRRFRLTPIDEAHRPFAQIDAFFRSLAREAGENALCVILSGTGTDGTSGLQAIKSAGGVAVVQQREGAHFPGMPDSAIATGLVDFVLPAEQIPARLIEIARHRGAMRHGGRGEALRGEIAASLARICEILAARGEGHDFSRYKAGTLVRRIERRMSLLRERSVDGLVATLEADGEERRRLSQDFLIGVTRFFRDPSAFEALRDLVLVPLVGRDPARLRVWVPGCSTGEEAYTIAMLALEACRKAKARTIVQVFGTDIDMLALHAARRGRFAATSLEDVPPELVERYLRPEGETYVAGTQLHEACIFAPQNLLVDPPFSRLDLVSCRNLLIYLDAQAQRAVLPRFHYALNRGGFLFLSPAESLGGGDKLFHTVDAAHRIFRRDDTARHGYSALRTGIRPRPLGPTQANPREGDRPAAASLGERARQFFLDEFAQAHAVVNWRGEIVHLSEGMTRFVRPRAGEPSTRIEDYLVTALRQPVRAGLADARADLARERREVVIGEGDERRLIAVEVAAMQDDLAMVVLHELRQPRQIVPGAAWTFPERVQLERELSATRQQLDAALTEYELSSQELRSTNEELLSMNEELQSANEELETSREELQSVNEELETMNAELSESNMQLQRVNSDLKNLLESTQIATLFLDGELCVRGFTPGAAHLFGVRERDTGRPVGELAWRFVYNELDEDAALVRRSSKVVEREISIPVTDQTFIMRIRPYRTVDDRIDGFVLTFFDITARKRGEVVLERQRRDLERQYGELQTLYDTTPVGLSLMDRDMRWLRINERMAQINGFPPEDHIGKRQDELIPDVSHEIQEMQRSVFETGEPVLGHQVTGETPAEPGRVRHWIADYYPVRSDDQIFAIGCCVKEVTEQRELERELQSSLSRLQLAVSRHPVSMHEIDGAGRLVWTLGDRPRFPRSKDVGRPFFETVPEQVEAQLAPHLETVLRTGESDRCDIELSGHETFDVSLEPVPDGSGAMMLWIDISERKAAEDRKALLLGELQHRVKNTLATTLSMVRFAAKSAADVEDMSDAVSERLMAISRTHDLLTTNAWTKVQAADIVEAELAPYDKAGTEVALDGLDVELSPRVALALALAVHELTTNSAKHGALAAGEGSLRIALSPTDAGLLRLSWREKLSIRRPVTSARSGFGRFLLETALPYQVDGTSDLVIDKAGVRFDLTFPNGRINEETR